MKNLTNDINANMFMALKVSEVTKVPFLFISAPGVGKSTSVEMFAEIRDYHLELLRGNSTSAEEVMGFDVFGGDSSKNSAKHLRPAWFNRILEEHEKGKKTLLFLDELTTANDYVQSALLHLVFERAVGEEKLPDDCLVVSAGNYSQSLGNRFALIPPLMNRFCIFNIKPTNSDITSFLSYYSGAGAKGKVDSLFESKRPLLENIDSQERALDANVEMTAAEFIEKAVLNTTLMLIQKEKAIDLSVIDMKDLYTDATAMLRGFATPRSLTYLVKIALGTYKCFGPEGIASDNFRNMIEGLCGIGLTNDGHGGTKTNYIAEKYHNYIEKAVNDVETKCNSSVSKYTAYFDTVILNGTTQKTAFTPEEIVTINNKFSELLKDDSIKKLERPINGDCLLKISSILKKSLNKVIEKANADAGNDSEKINITKEDLISATTQWNNIADSFSKIYTLFKDASNKYDAVHVNTIEKDFTEVGRSAFRIQFIYKFFTKDNPGVSSLIPKPHQLKK